jgi:DNA-binding NarL/FixJ family response regulator
MSVEALHQPADRRFRLLLIDQDAVFRLGLRVWLERYPELQIAAETADGEEALRVLTSNSTGDSAIDLVILDIGLGVNRASETLLPQNQENRLQGLTLCQQIKATYPQTPVLFLGTNSEPVLVAAAQQVGATGYCAKSVSAAELATVIRQVARGRSRFVERGLVERGLVERGSAESSPPMSRRPAAPLRLAPFSRLRTALRRSGLRQIEAALTEVNAELSSLDLSLLDRAILAGRQRELRAARRLVDWLRVDQVAEAAEVSEPPGLQGSTEIVAASSPPLSQIVGIADSRTLQSVLFDTVLGKLQSSLENQTEIPLETDILRTEKKRELFYLALRKLEDLLGELRYAEVQAEQLVQKRSPILLDLWQAIVIDFFGRYFTVTVQGTEVEVVTVLLSEAAIVQSAILDRIPGVVELLSHLLFQTPIEVDSLPCAAGNPAALSRAELLTENLLIQLANAVMQPLLNRFASVEPIKESFYQRRLSNREIERFRNDLSWKYRIERLFRDPQAIFESQHRLYVFSWKGIQKTTIYAPRNQELEQLSGVPLAITLVLETRDAIAPRLRSVVSLAGNGIIYVLTEVVGRSLGLIGRGILKGLGNAWQERR